MPGRVESGVAAEIGEAAVLRPGLAAMALCLARDVLDNPRAVSQHAAAAKVLARLLDELASVSARGRRGNLSLVKSMTTSSPPA